MSRLKIIAARLRVELKRNELRDRIDQSRTLARRTTLIVHRDRTSPLVLGGLINEYEAA